MNLLKLGVLVFFVGQGALCQGETISGQVYKKGTDRKEILFTYKNVVIDKAETKTAEAQFLDLQGHVVVSEKSEREGAKLKRYEIDHVQTGRKGSINIEGDKIIFNYEENGGKKVTESEKLTSNFIVGHTLVAYLFEHWPQIMSGETLDVRFGVWDRQETVGFSLFKVGEQTQDGQSVVLIKFKPSSFIIAALVDPVIFTLSSDGKTLLGMNGRVAPKRKDGSHWKDLDAEVIYKVSP